MPDRRSATVLLALAAALLTASATLSTPPRPAHAADAADLSRWRGKKRVLLVFAPSAKDADLAAQRKAFATSSAAAGLEDRDLVRYEALATGGGTAPGGSPLAPADAAALRRRYGVRADAFRVVLVGKDGHTAYSASRPVAPADLFARIDRMPMRRDEMRRRGR